MWYIFRHGETFANVNKNIIQGHMKNVFLTFNGALQAHINGQKLKKLEDNFDNYKIICSPLERAINTCQIIMNEININKMPDFEDLLLERSKGIFDGMLKIEAKKNYEKEYTLSKENLWSYDFGKIETYKVILLKLLKFYDKYKQNDKMIIVAHEGINNCLMYILKRKNEIENLEEWINNLSDEEGNKIAKEIKSVRFNQNYFYSWDGNKLEKI